MTPTAQQTAGGGFRILLLSSTRSSTFPSTALATGLPVTTQSSLPSAFSKAAATFSAALATHTASTVSPFAAALDSHLASASAYAPLALSWLERHLLSVCAATGAASQRLEK